MADAALAGPAARVPADPAAIVPSRRAEAERPVVCHDCGRVHRPVADPPDGGALLCARCGAVLRRVRHGGAERALALTLAAVVLFALANVFPFLTFSIEGRERAGTLVSGAVGLYQDGRWSLAGLVLLATIVLPTVRLAATLYVLWPLGRGGRPAPGAGRVFRWRRGLGPWSMPEIYLLGLLVAYVKLSDLAILEIGTGLWAFALLIVVLVAAEAGLDDHAVWHRLTPPGTPQPSATDASAVMCPGCRLLSPGAAAGGACRRCGAAVRRRKPDSLARTTALVLAAAVLYVPANLYPIMTVIYFGRGEPDTILSGVRELIASGMWPIAALVFVASIVVPVLKLIGLSVLIASVRRRSPGRRRDRTVLYRVIEFVGRWSMIDIFMISILVALVSLGAIATIEPGVGAVAFAAVVVLTMLASRAFDPRLIWDSTEDAREPHPARGA